MKKLLLFLLLIPVLGFGQATGYDLPSLSSSGSIGTAATTVDVYSRINIVATTTGLTFTVPNPTNTTTKVTEVWIENKGSNSFTLVPGGVIDTSSAIILKWIGSKYVVVGRKPTGGGTVTTVSVATANGFSGTVANATTTPAITLTQQNATTSQSGQLTSTDWNTFNNKLSTTSADAAYIRQDGGSNATTGNVSIGNFRGFNWDGSNYITGSTNLGYVQVRGGTYAQLHGGSYAKVSSANNTNEVLRITNYNGWYSSIFQPNTGNTNITLPATSGTLALQGDVPSGVSATAPVVYNSSTGVISMPAATGSVDGYLSATKYTDFQSAFTNRITSLTTTGSSGAATLSSNTLNIPNYTLSGLAGTQSANTFYAGPLTGSPATPTFRGLDLGDMPAFTGYAAGTTTQTVTSSDKAFTAIQKLDGNINVLTKKATTEAIGTLFSVSGSQWATSSASTNFFKNGTAASTFTFNSNSLTVASSANTLTELLQYSLVTTNYEQWEVPFVFTTPTLTGTQQSVTIGCQSTISLKFKFNFTTTGCVIECLYSNSVVATSANLPLTSTLITGSITRIKNRYIATIVDASGNTLTLPFDISTSYPATYYNVNACQFAIGAVNGTFTFTTFAAKSNMPKYAKFCLIGDSEAYGQFIDNIDNRHFNQFQRRTSDKCIVVAQQSNKITDVNAQEVINLAPEVIVLHIGTNDLSSGASTSTISSRMATLVSSFTSAGYTLGTTLRIGLLLPRNDFDVTAVNQAFQSTYGTACIDYWNPFKAASGTGINAAYTMDGIHINVDASTIMADIHVRNLNPTPANQPTPSIPIYRSDTPALLQNAQTFTNKNTFSNTTDVSGSSYATGDAALRLAGGLYAGKYIKTDAGLLVNTTSSGQSSSYEGTTTFNGSNNLVGMTQLTNHTIGSNTGNYKGISLASILNISSTGTTNNTSFLHSAVRGEINISGAGTGTLSGIACLQPNVTHAGTQLISELHAMNAQMSVNSGARVTTLYGSRMDMNVSGTVTTAYAYFVGSALGTGTATTKWAFYNNSTANSATLGRYYIGTSNATYRLTNSGSDNTGYLFVDPSSSLTAGTAFTFDGTNGLVFTQANGTRRIGSAYFKLINTTTTAGSEAADMGIYTQTAGAAPALSATVNSTGLKTIHLQGATSTPTIVAGAGAGTSPTVSIIGSDAAGVITITTGTAPTGSNAVIATITFNTSYTIAPYVVLTPTSRNSNGLIATSNNPIVPSQGETNGVNQFGFVLEANTVGLAAATTYKFTYQVIQ